jgi:hypothetical protein
MPESKREPKESRLRIETLFSFSSPSPKKILGLFGGAYPLDDGAAPLRTQQRVKLLFCLKLAPLNLISV